MMNNATTNTIDTRPVMRHMERWLVGLAMIVVAYLIEKAMLRSIRRNGTKAS